MEEFVQRIADKRPLTLVEAEDQCAGLRGIHRPRAKYPFLQCQLGRISVEQIKVNGNSDSTEFSGRVYVQYFHLVGFGPTWRAAIAMVKEKEANGGALRLAGAEDPIRGGFRCL